VPTPRVRSGSAEEDAISFFTGHFREIRSDIPSLSIGDGGNYASDDTDGLHGLSLGFRHADILPRGHAIRQGREF
jgi:hypothetical protein